MIWKVVLTIFYFSCISDVYLICAYQRFIIIYMFVILHLKQIRDTYYFFLFTMDIKY